MSDPEMLAEARQFRHARGVHDTEMRSGAKVDELMVEFAAKKMNDENEACADLVRSRGQPHSACRSALGTVTHVLIGHAEDCLIGIAQAIRARRSGGQA